MIKLYTRRELDEAVHNALVKAEAEYYERQRFMDIEKRLCDLEYRVGSLEPHRRPQHDCRSEVPTCPPG